MVPYELPSEVSWARRAFSSGLTPEAKQSVLAEPLHDLKHVPCMECCAHVSTLAGLDLETVVRGILVHLPFLIEHVLETPLIHLGHV
jgi:hypothetical protein